MLHLGALSVRVWGALSHTGLLFYILLQSWICKHDSWPPGEGPREAGWGRGLAGETHQPGGISSQSPLSLTLCLCPPSLTHRGIILLNGSIFKKICCA